MIAAVCRKPARGWRRRNVASHASVRGIFKEVSRWSSWVDFRSAIAQECRTRVGGLCESRGSTASVLAAAHRYVHSSAQTHCTLMFQHVSSPPDSAVDGED
eukprot:4624715-Pyramimonas_sp.AAC.1